MKLYVRKSHHGFWYVIARMDHTMFTLAKCDDHKSALDYALNHVRVYAYGGKAKRKG